MQQLQPWQPDMICKYTWKRPILVQKIRFNKFQNIQIMHSILPDLNCTEEIDRTQKRKFLDREFEPLFLTTH